MSGYRLGSLSSLLLLVSVLGSTGCVNEDIELWEMTLEVTVSSDDESIDAGPLFVELLHREVGTGELTYPLALIEAFEAEGPGSFAYSFDYPAHAGIGLVAYAWRDLDGDGVLCAPGAAEEPVGASEVSDLESYNPQVLILLDHTCIGPERFTFPSDTN